MFGLFRQQRSCAQLGELIADGLDAGGMSLLGQFEDRTEDFGATAEAITREVAFLDLFIAERAVNRMVSAKPLQAAILSACASRIVSRSGIFPDGHAFQAGYDSRWEKYTLFWRDALDDSAGIALAGQVIGLSGALPHYDLLMCLVQLITMSHTQVLQLLREYQKEFRLSL